MVREDAIFATSSSSHARNCKMEYHKISLSCPYAMLQFLVPGLYYFLL